MYIYSVCLCVCWVLGNKYRVTWFLIVHVFCLVFGFWSTRVWTESLAEHFTGLTYILSMTLEAVNHIIILEDKTVWVWSYRILLICDVASEGMACFNIKTSFTTEAITWLLISITWPGISIFLIYCFWLWVLGRLQTWFFATVSLNNFWFVMQHKRFACFIKISWKVCIFYKLW